jgi:MinD superfamily P-loop ATPase
MARKLETNVHLVFNKIPMDRSNEIDGAIEEFCENLGAELLGILTYDEVVAKTWSRKLVVSDGQECEYCNQVTELVEKLIN